MKKTLQAHEAYIGSELLVQVMGGMQQHVALGRRCLHLPEPPVTTWREVYTWREHYEKAKPLLGLGLSQSCSSERA